MRASILTLKDATDAPLPEAILEAVSAVTKVPVGCIMGPMRWPEYCRARHLYCYIARVYGQYKWWAISSPIKRDHATAHHGHCKVAADPAAYEPHLSRIISRLYPVRAAA